LSSAVRALSTPATAHVLERMHPMRTSRLLWSQQVLPALAWLPSLRSTMAAAGAADPQRDGNPWYAMERGASDAIARSIESWRVLRDQWAETLFEKLYPE
jgi:hypothetical protein